MAKPKSRAKDQWPLSKLREHPQQQALFGAISEQELLALATDMQTNGLQHAVEILPNGIILTGHQRVRAAQHLGWLQIEVVIRHDLAASGSAAEQHLINDNFVRRQLTPLGRARCIRRLMEIEEGRPSDRFGAGRRERLKARIASRMGLSTRTVSRYLLILETPASVQQAYDRGELSLVAAGQVALMREQAREEIAHRIECGEKPGSVVTQFRMRRDVGIGDPLRLAFIRLANTLRREIPAVKGRAAEIDARQLALRADSLVQAHAVLGELIAHVQPEYGQ